MAETVEEYLPEEYEMLVSEVANNLDEYDPEEEWGEDSSSAEEASEDSYDEDSEDSEDYSEY